MPPNSNRWAGISNQAVQTWTNDAVCHWLLDNDLQHFMPGMIQRKVAGATLLKVVTANPRKEGSSGISLLGLSTTKGSEPDGVELQGPVEAAAGL